MELDAVFEGGGVRGIAFVGAISEFDKAGFRWNNVAGTSAGAIIASLVAAGFSGPELEQSMREFNYLALTRKRGIANLPIVGPLINLWIKEGLFTGDYLLQWMTAKLRTKRISTFGDLPEGKLKVIASDVSNGKMLVLPDDLPKIGFDPKHFSVALAVRMSASLPFFLEPVIVKKDKRKIFVVDGGLLSTFPIWLFGDNPNSEYPTIGFRLIAGDEATPYNISNVIDYIGAMTKTMMHAHDQRYIDSQRVKRTIMIPTQGVSTAQFDITAEQREMLFTAGQAAARDFLKNMINIRKNGKTS